MERNATSRALTKLARTASAIVRATRPRQWTKNLLIVLPLLFTINELWTLDEMGAALDLFGRVGAAFALLCAASGAAYLFNDARDAERDRANPLKKHRPVASGELPAPLAVALALVVAITVSSLAFILDTRFGAVVVAYLVIQLAYSLGMKNLGVLDTFIVALGFVLRVEAGAAVLDVPVSPWLYLCTGLGAMFIALAKRRSELARAGESARDQRDALQSYQVPALDQFMGIVGTSALVSYALYTFTAENMPDNHAMMLTIPFLVYGLFRYIHLVHTGTVGETPEEIILSDWPMILAIVLWLGVSMVVLLVFR